ncbi:FAD-dependent oxidoreductase [Sporobolomyces salmoneus]|uniref:FAD-dependent oxidoreductase n=1 Tax=Sporobolomyces salmoneus TaxID=183962 RepID=UPI00317CC2D3
MSESQQHIVVIGSGVIGLSTAIKLQESGYRVSIVARDLPGDRKGISWASPWAGAHHVSVANGNDLRMHRFDARTFQVMSEMIEQDSSSQVPLTFAPQIEYREEPKAESSEGDLSQLNLISRFHPNFRWLDPSELPSGIAHGASFTCILIDTPAYLPYLLSRFLAKSGQIHRSSTLPSLASALSAHPSLDDADLIVNCTGLGSRSLVNDTKAFPTRGQLVIVRAPWMTTGMTRLGKGVYDYIIPRRNGLVVLGGCAEKDNWDSKPREDMSRRIKTRCLDLCRELLPPSKREKGSIDDLEVVEEAVGLRPTREGGIRLEIEEIEGNEPGRKLKVVHHYGHGGYGYQSSWGSAEAAVDLVNSALGRTSSQKSKL